MKAIVRAKLVGTIADFDTPEYQPTDESETEYVKEYFGNRPAVQEFDAFLVKVGDGDYDDVLGFHGNIPNIGKNVWRITRTYSESKPKAKTAKPKSKSRSKNDTPTSLRGMR